MINRKQAQKRIIEFAYKHEGETFDVATMNGNDMYDYILADTYLMIDAMLGYDADVNIILDRAIENAEKHKRDNFKTFIADNKDKELRIL